MPKEEIQAVEFLRRFPKCDGRGVIVAVFDTGCDPGAEGLQVCPDGTQKMIDVIDCTGAGDVDTSHTAEAENGTLKGLSGRTLTLPSSWPPLKASTKKYFLGIKRAFELYPRGLESRVKAERRKAIDAAQREALAKCQAALLSEKPDEKTAEGKKMAEELKARDKLLAKLDSEYEDCGPLYDVLCYLDEADKWRICVDTSESGDLSSCVLLEPYRLGGKFGTLDSISLLNYAVDVMDEGTRVVISVDSGAHGTHVAGILGAHHPNAPELNGVAPGCKIVGIKIGDTRLGSMETGTGLVRALGAALARGVHLINLSFGEYSDVDNVGRFTEMCARAVDKHGMLFVTSAGNNGPALTTGGAPGTSECTIAVGAFASALMMGPQYSLRSKLPDIQFTWSSRGPTVDGAELVSISAPGGAIAPVPTWTLNGRQLMNGTSMASPNACGGIALLLSAMHHAGHKWSPRRIRMAIEATARATPNATVSETDRWALGRGLLDVNAAYDWLIEHVDDAQADMRFVVSASVNGAGTAQGSSGRGVYLREPQHTSSSVACAVSVKPTLHDDAPNTAKVAVDVATTLTASAPWVRCGSSLALNHAGKGFEMTIDAGSLPPGAHFAEVLGHDHSKPASYGPIFRVPITVMKPHANLDDGRSGVTYSYESLPFTPGHIERRFVVPPLGATWATVTLEARATPRSRSLSNGPVPFMLHTTQLLPSTGMRYSEYSTRASLGLTTDSGAPPTQFIESIAITGGVLMEVTVAQWWAALGETEVSMSVEFYGVTPIPPALHMDGRALFSEMQLHAPFRRTPVDPSGELTTLLRGVRPHAAKLLPPAVPVEGGLTFGDQWPESRIIYDYVLGYKFSLSTALKVSVRFPSLCCQLYESPWEAQLWAIFDSNKRLIVHGDYYAEPTKLPQGDYTVRLQVRHDKPDLLQKLRHMPMVLRMTLASPLKLGFHWSRTDAVPNAKAASRVIVEANSRLALYVTVKDAMPDHAAPGDSLSGTFTLARLNSTSLGASTRPTAYEVSLVVPPAEIKDKEDGTEGDNEADEVDPASQPALDEAVRALRITQLGTLATAIKKASGEAEKSKEVAEAERAKAAAQLAGDKERYDALLASLQAECMAASASEQLLELKVAHLGHQDTLASRTDATALESVIRLAGEVTSLVDSVALGAALAVNVDKDEKAATKQRKKDDGKKKALVTALHLKAMACADLYDAAIKAAATKPDGPEATGQPLAALDAAVAELHKWASPSDHKKLAYRWHKAHGRFATAMGVLTEGADKEKSPPGKEALEQRNELLEGLGWAHWAAASKAKMHVLLPKHYPLVFKKLDA